MIVVIIVYYITTGIYFLGSEEPLLPCCSCLKSNLTKHPDLCANKTNTAELCGPIPTAVVFMVTNQVPTALQRKGLWEFIAESAMAPVDPKINLSRFVNEVVCMKRRKFRRAFHNLLENERGSVRLARCLTPSCTQLREGCVACHCTEFGEWHHEDGSHWTRKDPRDQPVTRDTSTFEPETLEQSLRIFHEQRHRLRLESVLTVQCKSGTISQSQISLESLVLWYAAGSLGGTSKSRHLFFCASLMVWLSTISPPNPLVLRVQSYEGAFFSGEKCWRHLTCLLTVFVMSPFVQVLGTKGEMKGDMTKTCQMPPTVLHRKESPLVGPGNTGSVYEGQTSSGDQHVLHLECCLPTNLIVCGHWSAGSQRKWGKWVDLCCSCWSPELVWPSYLLTLASTAIRTAWVNPYIRSYCDPVIKWSEYAQRSRYWQVCMVDTTEMWQIYGFICSCQLDWKYFWSHATSAIVEKKPNLRENKQSMSPTQMLSIFTVCHFKVIHFSDIIRTLLSEFLILWSKSWDPFPGFTRVWCLLKSFHWLHGTTTFVQVGTQATRTSFQAEQLDWLVRWQLAFWIALSFVMICSLQTLQITANNSDWKFLHTRAHEHTCLHDVDRTHHHHLSLENLHFCRCCVLSGLVLATSRLGSVAVRTGHSSFSGSFLNSASVNSNMFTSNRRVTRTFPPPCSKLRSRV